MASSCWRTGSTWFNAVFYRRVEAPLNSNVVMLTLRKHPPTKPLSGNRHTDLHQALGGGFFPTAQTDRIFGVGSLERARYWRMFEPACKGPHILCGPFSH